MVGWVDGWMDGWFPLEPVKWPPVRPTNNTCREDVGKMDGLVRDGGCLH